MIVVKYLKTHPISSHPQDWTEQTSLFDTLIDAIAFAEQVENPHYKTLIIIPMGDLVLKIELQAFRSGLVQYGALCPVWT